MILLYHPARQQGEHKNIPVLFNSVLLTVCLIDGLVIQNSVMRYQNMLMKKDQVKMMMM